MSNHLEIIQQAKIIFDNKAECIKEKNIQQKLNVDGPVFIIKNKDDMEKYIYPKIEEFHKKRKINKYKVSNNNIFNKDINTLFSNKKLSIYDTSDKQSTYNTLNYVFDEFHTSVFVQILNNKIQTFMVLKNYKLYPGLMDKLKIDKSEYNDIDDFIKKNNEEYFRNLKIIKNQEDSIYFTDCYINLWSIPALQAPAWWIYIYQLDMLNQLLQNKKINDVEFILNYKDQNMLVKDGQSNPHYHILGNLTTPLNKKYKSFIPILNIGSHTKFADLPIPTNDDWEICTNKIYLGACRDLYYNITKEINTNFDSKINTAIFRGSSTGCGTVIKNNPRLKAAFLTRRLYKHPKYGIDNSYDGVLYLDARITKFSSKVKKHYSDEYIHFVNPKKLKLKPASKMSINMISNYKYILSIEGNIAAFRLSLELAYNSVILLVKSDFYIWYQPLLKPWIHYVPIKKDLSDLVDKIDWCKKNDNKCKIIASNALEFYKKYINKNSINDYLEILFNI